MVRKSSKHLLSLINDVLDISKIEAGQLSLDLETFEILPSLEQTFSSIEPLAQEKGLALNLYIEDRLILSSGANDLLNQGDSKMQNDPQGEEVSVSFGRLHTDKRRFEQILLNLLNNAVKFTEEGHIDLHCRREQGMYQFSVSDTGIGIQKEDLEKLFTPFHQVSSGLTRKHDGTGLGLSICKKLTEMMGGSINAESRFGEGSTFTIFLPDKAPPNSLV